MEWDGTHTRARAYIYPAQKLGITLFISVFLFFSAKCTIDLTNKMPQQISLKTNGIIRISYAIV